MAEVQAHRTLVKSPPELWAELSDPESLARHLGEFGEVRITRTDPETTVAWEGEQVSGTVEIAPSGWGTQVSLSARIATPEPVPPAPVPPPARVEHVVLVIGEDVVRIEPQPQADPDPEPQAEAETEPRHQRRRLFARMFRRRPASEAVPEIELAPPPEAEPTPLPEPYELRLVHAVVACRVPERPALPEPPQPEEPTFDAARAASVLGDVLEHLGAAHHRPFSRA